MKAKELNRILITRDKDFGRIVFLNKNLLTGVIFLRMTPETLNDVQLEFEKLIQEHSEEELSKCFCVVESNRHRIRRLK